MKITKGKKQSAMKIVVYGPEGIGKSTFASMFPDPLFCDTEGSTNHMDVARFDKPTSWTILNQQLDFVKQNKPCKTFIIDTFDWAEQLCIENLCATHGKKGIEDFGYGNGYVYEKEDIGRFLNKLQELIEIGIHVVLTCHAHIKKFEQPDELGAYDRWELKLGKKTGSQISPLIKEWADMLLFANYKTLAVATDKEGKKFKAQGGKRIMHTTHHPCWDAKNRFGLAEELPFEFGAIAHLFTQSPIFKESTLPSSSQSDSIAAPSISSQPDPVLENINPDDYEELEIETKTSETKVDDLSDLPQGLADLMHMHKVSRQDIQWAVSDKGYYPIDAPIQNYDETFIQGVLIGAWDKVHALIMEHNKIPF